MVLDSSNSMAGKTGWIDDVVPPLLKQKLKESNIPEWVCDEYIPGSSSSSSVSKIDESVDSEDSDSEVRDTGDKATKVGSDTRLPDVEKKDTESLEDILDRFRTALPTLQAIKEKYQTKRSYMYGQWEQLLLQYAQLQDDSDERLISKYRSRFLSAIRSFTCLSSSSSSSFSSNKDKQENKIESNTNTDDDWFPTDFYCQITTAVMEVCDVFFTF